MLLYAMRLGRTFGGAWGGRLAVALVACDPNLLGHAALATTDIALVACMISASAVAQQTKTVRLVYLSGYSAVVDKPLHALAGPPPRPPDEVPHPPGQGSP